MDKMKHVIFDCDGTLFDTSLTKYQLFQGIRELLSELQGECLFYVWTARGRNSTIKLLQDAGIYSYFDGISTPDDSPGKPHVQGLVSLVGNSPKSSICVIGDSINDMIGAKNFGVLAFGATWNNLSSREYLIQAGADFIVSHPSECSKLIQLKLKGETHV
jgi:phosphoglycolate phosphatase-like HAD superfamily hydrolase